MTFQNFLLSSLALKVWRLKGLGKVSAWRYIWQLQLQHCITQLSWTLFLERSKLFINNSVSRFLCKTSIGHPGLCTLLPSEVQICFKDDVSELRSQGPCCHFEQKRMTKCQVYQKSDCSVSSSQPLTHTHRAVSPNRKHSFRLFVVVLCTHGQSHSC